MNLDSINPTHICFSVCKGVLNIKGINGARLYFPLLLIIAFLVIFLSSDPEVCSLAFIGFSGPHFEVMCNRWGVSYMLISVYVSM